MAAPVRELTLSCPWGNILPVNGIGSKFDWSEFMTRRHIVYFIAYWIGFAIILLAPQSYAAQADWKKDWEQTVAAAKKEGQVTVYIYRYEGLLQDFKRDYPGINVVAVSGRGNDLTNRIIAERRGGKF